MLSRVLTSFVFVVLLGLFVGCWPKKAPPQDSELDAITAASKRIFGKNVRGYMWALTTDSPALFAQPPGSLRLPDAAQPVALDPFADNLFVDPTTPPQAAVGPISGKTGSEGAAPTASVNPFKTEYFQCWYYAETAVYEKLEGQALRQLFLDKTKTKRINNNFLDVRHLYDDLERSEALKNLESFAISALPGTCFLFSAIGPLKGKAKGALSSAFCSISLASLSATRKPSGDGWGSDKARQHIQNQLRARVNELDEVNWDVLAHLKNKVAEYNSANKFAETTQVQCPTNEAWVAELMGPGLGK